jgi:hypothetical protein
VNGVAKIDAGRPGAGVLGLPETVTAGLFDLDAQLLDAGKGSVAR